MKYINLTILIIFLFFEITSYFYQWYGVNLKDYSPPVMEIHEYLSIISFMFFVVFLCEWLLTFTTNLWHKLFAFNFGLIVILHIAIKFYYIDYISTLGIVISILASIIFSIFIQRKKIHHSKIFILSLIAIFIILNTHYNAIFGLQYTVDLHFFSSIFIAIFFVATYILNWYEEKIITRVK